MPCRCDLSRRFRRDVEAVQDVFETPVLPGDPQLVGAPVIGRVQIDPVVAGFDFGAGVETLLPVFGSAAHASNDLASGVGSDFFAAEALAFGFDAHADDPLAELNLQDDDFRWLARRLLDLAADACDGRLVATLEGGYDLAALARSAALFVKELHGASV